MEFGPILKSLRHHKTGTLLVALQIAVSLAIIVNALFIIAQRVEKVNRPTGMDTDNIIVATVRGVGKNYDRAASIRRDLDMLRNLPGVIAVTSSNAVPLSGSGSGNGFRAVPDENVTATSANQYRWDEYGVATHGVNIVRGRNFYPEEIVFSVAGESDPVTPSVVIVTQEFADTLYPEEDALGKPVYFGNMESASIIGIIDHMQGAWPGWQGLNRVLISPRLSAGNHAMYIIRTEPGLRDSTIPVVEQKLTDADSTRVIGTVRTHTDIIKRSYELDALMANILSAVIVLLVGLTALVTVGLASYFVSQRTKQIGTRRALGATRLDILRYFLTENWIITTLGIVLGSVLTVVVAYVLETSFSLPRLDWRYLAVSIMVLWLISLLAAWFPARRASLIPPAVATRTV